MSEVEVLTEVPALSVQDGMVVLTNLKGRKEFKHEEVVTKSKSKSKSNYINPAMAFVGLAAAGAAAAYYNGFNTPEEVVTHLQDAFNSIPNSQDLSKYVYSIYENAFYAYGVAGEVLSSKYNYMLNNASTYSCSFAFSGYSSVLNNALTNVQSVAAGIAEAGSKYLPDAVTYLPSYSSFAELKECVANSTEAMFEFVRQGMAPKLKG